MKRYAVVVDVGCIECGEATEVLFVSEDFNEALKYWIKYTNGKNKPIEREELDMTINYIKQWTTSFEEDSNTYLISKDYFSSGQHSVELHLYPNVEAFKDCVKKCATGEDDYE